VKGKARARAVFLDRDGVLNDVVYRAGRAESPRSPAEFRINPDAAAACARLKDAGFLIVVATNQPDVARGQVTPEVLHELHDILRRAVSVDDIVVCPHDDADGCECRKPLPGLLVEAAHRWGADLGASFFIGDRWRDVDAGKAAGCTAIFLDRGDESEKTPEGADLRFHGLLEAAEWILSTAAQ